MRLIQTNLRETDMNLDVDKLFQKLTEYSANVLLINMGGIVSFYPTKLEYQYRARGQTKDLLKEVTEKARELDVRVMVRFDFSKAQEQLYEEKPEWFYQTYDGNEINYHGVVHTCVNGYYQREYSIKIIDEVISNYDVDGVFFNMFGYQTSDYSGNYYGQCYCDNCKKRFKERYNLDLPKPKEANKEVLKAYAQFQRETTEEMLDKIHKFVKGKDPNLAISTYHHHKVDIVKNESNTALSRPLPKWVYSASENVKTVQDTSDDQYISNVCINAIDLVHRFTGVSKYEVAIRLFQSIASGSGLDFCIIGVFEDYPDREHAQVVKDIFDLHKRYESYFGSFESVAKVALVKPNLHVGDYLGIFKMLKEEHKLFDVIQQSKIQDNLEQMKRYEVIILPQLQYMNKVLINALAELQKAGVRIIATGRLNREAIFELFSAELIEQVSDTHAAYLDTRGQIMKRFVNRDRIVLDGEFLNVKFPDEAQTDLKFITPAVYGPPERTGGHQLTNMAGLGIVEKSHANHAYLPWGVGSHYYKTGFEDFKHVLLDAFDRLNISEQALTVDAPQSVEIFFNKINAHQYLLQVLNLSGFNGMTYTKPIDISNIAVALDDIRDVVEIKELEKDIIIPFSENNGQVTFTIDKLSMYSSLVVTTES